MSQLDHDLESYQTEYDETNTCRHCDTPIEENYTYCSKQCCIYDAE